MRLEQRGRVKQPSAQANRQREEPVDAAKPYCISKQQVYEAYLRVKANKGAAGIDDETIEDFESKLKDNLYRIWNRMSSGSYFPPPVKAVEIPKSDGKTRILGIPTIGDRIAQTVAKMQLEPVVEPKFHEDSYGYRPGKSAHQAIATARQRCWRCDWVIDIDIRAFFDNLDHELVMKALRYHAVDNWVLLYVERWLKAPLQTVDGLQARTKGTPQGGVVTPPTQLQTLNGGAGCRETHCGRGHTITVASCDKFGGKSGHFCRFVGPCYCIAQGRVPDAFIAARSGRVRAVTAFDGVPA